MNTYQVDENLIPDYIKKVKERMISSFLLILVIVLILFACMIHGQNKDFLILPFSLIVSIGCFTTFMLMLKQLTYKLEQLTKANYYIDECSIKFQNGDQLIAFNMNEIAVFHKKHSGTYVVKGDSWTKINYIFPKRGPRYKIGNADTIFIPTITSNYDELINHIYAEARNAFKINVNAALASSMLPQSINLPAW